MKPMTIRKVNLTKTLSQYSHGQTNKKVASVSDVGGKPLP